MKIRMNRLASALAITLIAVSLVFNSATAQQEQGKERGGRDKGNSSICLVVEEGFVIPTQPLDRLGSGGLTADYATGLEVMFRLDGGSAQFEQTGGRLIQSIATNGRIELPPIKAGRAGDESVMTVLVDGEEAIERFRVITVTAEAINLLQQHKIDNQAALLALQEHYAIVDSGKLTGASGAFVSEQVSLNGEPIREEEGQLLYSFAYPWKPGLVVWCIPDPKGAGYSIFPENASSLQWASAPQNAVEGIYNKYWGSKTALKIPDHCTATVYKNGWTGICDPVISIFQGKIRWVTPGQGKEDTWPKDPLR